MAANQIDSEQAFSGVAQTANIGSSTSVSSGAAKIFREFKWGLLTLFILMTVVVCLVYDGGRGKKKTDTAATKSYPSDPEQIVGTDTTPSTGASTDSNGVATNTMLTTPPLTATDHTVSRADESKDPWRADPTTTTPQSHKLNSSDSNEAAGTRIPDPANDEVVETKKSSDKPHHKKESKELAETREPQTHAAEREATMSSNGAYKWYVVKAGDNLTRIANANLPGKGGNKAILEANKDTLPDANKLREGLKIRIPNSIGSSASVAVSEKPEPTKSAKSGEHKAAQNVITKDDYVVVAGDTLERIARKVLNDSRKWKELQAWNKDRVADSSKLRVGMVLRIHASSTPASTIPEVSHRKHETVRAEAEPQTAGSNDVQLAPADEVPLPIQPIAANVTSPANRTDFKSTKNAVPEQRDDEAIKGVILP